MTGKEALRMTPNLMKNENSISIRESQGVGEKGKNRSANLFSYDEGSSSHGKTNRTCPKSVCI